MSGEVFMLYHTIFGVSRETAPKTVVWTLRKPCKVCAFRDNSQTTILVNLINLVSVINALARRIAPKIA